MQGGGETNRQTHTNTDIAYSLEKNLQLPVKNKIWDSWAEQTVVTIVKVESARRVVNVQTKYI